MKLLLGLLLLCMLCEISISHEICNEISDPSLKNCQKDCFCSFCMKTEQINVSTTNSSYMAELQIPICCFGDSSGPSEDCECSNETWIWNKETSHRDKVCWSQLYLLDAFFGLLTGFMIIIVSVTMIYLAEVHWIEKKRKPFSLS